MSAPPAWLAWAALAFNLAGAAACFYWAFRARAHDRELSRAIRMLCPLLDARRAAARRFDAETASWEARKGPRR